jgi:hypothetical protein
MARKQFSPAIEALWREHSADRFPEGLAGEEVDGICVTSLDTFTAGCLSTFFSRRGSLDLGRTAILGLCYRDLSVVVAGLKGEQRRYFARLEQLARMVLEAVRDEANSA